MLDFLKPSYRTSKHGAVEVYPKFIGGRKSQDLMIRGGDFYAVWNESEQIWLTDENDCLNMIDEELIIFAKKYEDEHGIEPQVMYMWDYDNGLIDKWHKYCSKQLRDSWNQLNANVIFSNTIVKKEDYSSKRLGYPLENGSIDAYEELVSTLYEDEQRMKFEWAIGSIVCGDSKKIQKFCVFHGDPGSGKSTVINIIWMLFDKYAAVFDAKSLGTGAPFALEPFKENPLVAIQHDGDLSKIEDNTKLNSLVSHEIMPVNEKFKSVYSTKFNSFLFMGTNKPVKITDAKSGLIRRLIDIHPSGKKVDKNRYDQLINAIPFEKGAIAYHCLQVYQNNKNYYDDYIPSAMLKASNDFYNFILYEYDKFEAMANGVSGETAWNLYQAYCESAKVPYTMSRRPMQEELKNYFDEYFDKFVDENGNKIRDGYYRGFKTDKFQLNFIEPPTPNTTNDIQKEESELDTWIKFGPYESILDKELSSYPAQYAGKNEAPKAAWDSVKTTLADINTKKLHYVNGPEWLIVIDFDLKDENGNKSFKRNLEAASAWPRTYAELSKSGEGIHLHYIYEGDVSKLSILYDTDIEVKVYRGGSALRRKLTRCTLDPIAKVTFELPLKKGGKVVNQTSFKSEGSLRNMINRNLHKEFGSTRCSIDFIYNNLNDAYEAGLKYDVSDMRNDIFTFALHSTHQSDYCKKKVMDMKFRSDDIPEAESQGFLDDRIAFFDVEVFPNLFIVVWKFQNPAKPVIMINPSPDDINSLLRYKLVGFNNRKYDNHILYARAMGKSIYELYLLSKEIINSNNRSDAFIGNAYNVSYTDIYDFSSKKQSLKKFEIELDIHHQELGFNWDEAVPEDQWETVAKYCVNDVIATEAVWENRQADFIAREILAAISGGTVNDTTNTLTKKLIFGNNQNPQNMFMYRDLSKPVHHLDPDMEKFLKENFPEMMATRHGPEQSLLPYFPGYKYSFGVSSYKGVDDIGEGGRVWAKPGMYGRTVTFDVASMHPHSVTSEYLFGKYTEVFNDLLNARIYIKHKDFEKAKTLFGGKLAPYLDDPAKAKALSGALKIAINSVYGLTAAKFKNQFRDDRNVDNIVAKRGALFMVDLMDAVTERGGTVVHIKTDSIKVLDPSPELQDFIIQFGKRYGYDFEIEHIFERFCLVNNAVYIAKTASDDPEMPNQWTATGTQFQIPYVFKTLFSKEPIDFFDYCVTQSVSTAIYMDFNESQVIRCASELSDFMAHDFDLEDYIRDDTYIQKLISNARKKNSPLVAAYDDESVLHSLRFVGKVGSFVPVAPGKGGAVLLRDNGKGGFGSVGGAKGYRWVEAEMIRETFDPDIIDKEYFRKLIDDAKDAISEYGDFEHFANDDIFENVYPGQDDEDSFEALPFI